MVSFKVHNEKGFVRFLATMLAYGFFGDIINQSDKWRYLGPLRYDLSGFCQFVLNRSYHTELTITLSPHDLSQMSREGTTSSSSMNNTKHVNHGTHPTELVNASQSTGNQNNQVIQNLIAPVVAFCSRNCEICALADEHDTGKVRSSLQIKREGRYTTINCLNMPGRCAKSKFGMSPFVHLGM